MANIVIPSRSKVLLCRSKRIKCMFISAENLFQNSQKCVRFSADKVLLIVNHLRTYGDKFDINLCPYLNARVFQLQVSPLTLCGHTQSLLVINHDCFDLTFIPFHSVLYYACKLSIAPGARLCICLVLYFVFVSVS